MCIARLVRGEDELEGAAAVFAGDRGRLAGAADVALRDISRWGGALAALPSRLLWAQRLEQYAMPGTV